MANCTTPAQLAQAQTKRFANAKLSMSDMLRIDANDGRQVFTQSVSGTLTKQQTRGAFARGTSPGKGQLQRRRVPGLPINMQTGLLRSEVRAWRQTSDVYLLGAYVPYAKFVLHPAGTRKMVARTINGRPLMTGRQLGLTRMGLLEQRHNVNNLARREALKQAHRSI